MRQALDAKTLKKIRIRAFKHLDKIRQERQRLQNEKYMLDALHEVTGLPLRELEAIARDVGGSHDGLDENFFSIRNQLLIAFAVLGLAGLFICLLVNM